MTDWQIVDLYLADLKARGQSAFLAADLKLWLDSHPTISGYGPFSSFMLQAHKDAQRRGITAHYCYCTRRGPYAPWRVEHAGAADRSMDIKTHQLLYKDVFVDFACRALPLALREDEAASHVKAQPSDPDGPALAGIKQKITNMGFSVNAVLVSLGGSPVDVPKLLARY